MKSILTNTVKITVAAVLAILCAQALKLDFAVSAGIVAILSVQPTKKETLRTALSRLLAFAVALVISITLFNLLGFTVPVFFIYLLIFILVCQWRKWISAMAMDSVLISHFLSFGKTGPAEIKNEILLFVLGVAFGILVNLLLHKKTDYIEELKKQTDNQIKQALHRMVCESRIPLLQITTVPVLSPSMKASSPPRNRQKKITTISFQKKIPSTPVTWICAKSRQRFFMRCSRPPEHFTQLLPPLHCFQIFSKKFQMNITKIMM